MLVSWGAAPYEAAAGAPGERALRSAGRVGNISRSAQPCVAGSIPLTLRALHVSPATGGGQSMAAPCRQCQFVNCLDQLQQPPSQVHCG